ncbi:MAG: YceD family protein [Methylocella sp.]
MISKSDPRSDKARRAAAGDLSLESGANALSRIVEIDEVPEGGLQVAIRADAAERAAIAENAGLIAVESLEADLDVAKLGEGKFQVAGPLRARIVQTCVVSLEPFESEIHAEVAADFAGQAKKSLLRRGKAAREAMRDTESRDDLSQSFAAQLDAPDPIVDGRIDLGALAVEFFILNLDPYPRKPGVRFEGAEFSSSPDAAASPFAILKNLKDDD